MLLGFLVAIVVLVGVHEFGHFIVARLCGVKVLRFCIGMGTPFWSYTDKKGTEFGVTAIPLGGYVSMLGEEHDDIRDDERHMSFQSKSLWQRIAIMSAGPVANFLFAIVVFTLMFFIYGKSGTAAVIGEVEPGSFAEQAGLEPKQIIVEVDGVATPTRIDVIKRMFMRLGETGHMELAVVVPGSESHIHAELRLDSWMAGSESPDPMAGVGLAFRWPDTYIGAVADNSPAAEFGLLVKDIILAMDGEPMVSRADIIDYIATRPGVPIELTVMRDGFETLVVATPESVETEKGAVGRLGVHLAYMPTPKEWKKQRTFNVFEAVAEGVMETGHHIKFILISIKKLVLTEISPKNLSGPIGIAKVAGDQVKAGLSYFIPFLAILSIYLGVMNLLPIPVLDGGQILFCLVEAIKGSPVSEKVRAASVVLGLLAMVSLMLVASYFDVLRLTITND